MFSSNITISQEDGVMGAVIVELFMQLAVGAFPDATTIRIMENGYPNTYAGWLKWFGDEQEG